MLEILALSCQDAEKSAEPSREGKHAAMTNAKAESYLMRKNLQVDDAQEMETKSKTSTSNLDFEARFKDLFSQLIAKGMDPNAAAAEAIKQATVEQKYSASLSTKLEAGTLDGTIENNSLEMEMNTVRAVAAKTCQLNLGDKIKVSKVLSIAKKYVANVQKDPANPRFRNFRLSNKVFDQITSTPGGIELLVNLGFAIFHSDTDFMASIPLAVNLTLMADVMDSLFKAYTGDG